MLALLDEIRREHGVAVLFISHDIDVVRLFCERIVVMYLGEVVERGTVSAVLEAPAHPYTRVLLGSIPTLDPEDRTLARPLTETIPDPADPPAGCRFHTRCPAVIQPEELDLPARVWESLAEFRFTIQAGELSDEILAAEDGTTVREQFSLPEPLPDGTAEAAVADAIDSLLDGDAAGAAARLQEVTATVCEQQHPGGASHEGRPVACHRYDSAVGADPLPEDG